eukprot:TRINITY_DN11193_c0_g1_i1.p3 TRINITY_DN11193_c0_g1~~TRINITY_DN11193_c0_g1_i1.p3  ORF type:complete len:103 (+),score=23.47 TRINITY_DN11193_c0_g1_i1:31-339(+)
MYPGLAPGLCSPWLPPEDLIRPDNAASGPSTDIDSEDDDWDGTIEPTAFEQVRESEEKKRIIARLESMNRRPNGGAAEDSTRPQDTGSVDACKDWQEDAGNV